MTELLLNRSSSAARTSQLVIEDAQHQSKGEVVVHPDVASNRYLFLEAFEIDPAQVEIRRLVGNLVLVFRGETSGRILYLYGQPEPFKAAANSVGVPVGLFQQLHQLAQQSRAPLTLRFHSVLFRLGTRPVENRPMFKITQDLRAYRAQTGQGPTAPQARAAQPALRQPVNPAMRASGAPQRRPQGAPAYRTFGHYAYDDRNDYCDTMFRTRFPGIAPVYSPNGVLAWYLWFNSMNYMPGQYFYDPYALNDWAFVPGFPGAVSQVIVPFGDGYRVEILDTGGLCMANFAFSGFGEQMQIITGDGDAFTVVNAGQPYIQYCDGGDAFFWNGIDTPFFGPQLEMEVAILDAGPLYEPGVAFYQDPFMAGAGVQYMEPAYPVGQEYVVDPGYAVDPTGNPVYQDGGIYQDGAVQQDPYIEPNPFNQPDPYNQPEPYYEPPAQPAWQDAPATPDASYVEPPQQQYETVDNSYQNTTDYSDSGGDVSVSNDDGGGSFGGGGGGDDWS
jgi:hypothetical protein